MSLEIALAFAQGITGYAGAQMAGREAGQAAARTSQTSQQLQAMADVINNKLKALGLGLTEPFREAGVSATDRLKQEITNPDLFGAGFDAARDRGLRDIKRNQAAKGQLGSTRTLEIASDFETELVGSELAKRREFLTNTANLAGSTIQQDVSNINQTQGNIQQIVSGGSRSLSDINAAGADLRAANIGAATRGIQEGVNAYAAYRNK